MRALASSLGAWESLERQERIQAKHGLTFALAVVGAIGAEHGLELVAEERAVTPAIDFDAIFISVYDARTMMGTRAKFDAWKVPMRRQDRTSSHPLVWAGGQGLHNPMPYYDVADVIVVGDAEEPLPRLLELWARHGRNGFFAAASTVPGALVPAHHDPSEATIIQATSTDIGTSLRKDIRVNSNGLRRMEIARNCKHKCMFCGLGWRATYRENPTNEVVRVIELSPKEVHLQAGDAESHSGIDAMRAALLRAGSRDSGWTGRLDTVGDEVASEKRYAFGVEAMTYRVRRAIGKNITDEDLVSSTARVMRSIRGEGKGRTCWHMIAGLPGERPKDIEAFLRILGALDDRMRGRTPRNLTIHWQPFQPLPGTPMQWFACGSGARKLSSMIRVANSWAPVRSLAGRSDDVAKICTVLARADRRGVDLLDAIGVRRVTPNEAAKIAGSCYLSIDPDVSLPWDWIRHTYPKSVLRRGYESVIRRLSQ